MGFRVPFEGFGVLWEQGKDGGISSPIPCVFDETPSNQLLRFLVHLIYIRIFWRNHVHISVVLFFFIFSPPSVSARLFLEVWVSLQYFRVVGFAVPVLARKDEEEKVGLTASHISAIGPTRLSSRGDQCYFTREDKHGSRPSNNFGFHW